MYSEANVQKTKGFTLIELSIVIIIIGFLVAGVAAGNEIIHTVKLKRYVTQITEIDNAVTMFEAQYKYLPGDFPNAQAYWPDCQDGTTFPCNGNGDGKMNAHGVPYGAERDRAFEHLSKSKFIAGNFSPITPTNNSGSFFKPGITAPFPPFEGGCYRFGNWSFGGPSLILAMAELDPFGGCNIFGSDDGVIFTPAEAYYLEQALDPLDGQGNEKIISHCAPGARAGGPHSGAYNLGLDKKMCMLMYRTRSQNAY